MTIRPFVGQALRAVTLLAISLVVVSTELSIGVLLLGTEVSSKLKLGRSDPTGARARHFDGIVAKIGPIKRAR